MPLHRVPERQRVPLRGRPGRQGPQQRLGERDQAGHGGERVPRQTDEVPLLRDPGQQHRVSGTHRDPVHQQLGAETPQRGVHMVDRARGRAARGDHDVGLTGRQRLVEGVLVVPDPPYVDHVGAERAQPRRQEGAQRVPDQPVVRQSLPEQLVTEHEHGCTGPGDDGERVVPGRRGHAQHRGSDQRAHGQQLVSVAALLAPGADVLAVRDGVRRRVAAVACSRPPSSVRPCSLRSTAVVSGGMRAPVAILTASPSVSGACAVCPARTPSSRTSQGPGPDTAQPSMADVSNDGRSVSAIRGRPG